MAKRDENPFPYPDAPKSSPKPSSSKENGWKFPYPGGHKPSSKSPSKSSSKETGWRFPYPDAPKPTRKGMHWTFPIPGPKNKEPYSSSARSPPASAKPVVDRRFVSTSSNLSNPNNHRGPVRRPDSAPTGVAPRPNVPETNKPGFLPVVVHKILPAVVHQTLPIVVKETKTVSARSALETQPATAETAEIDDEEDIVPYVAEPGDRYYQAPDVDAML